MVSIIGLGNPGEEYERTRHNLGFRVLAALQKEINFPDFTLRKKFFAEISEGKYGPVKVVLAKPQTFMNQSGRAIGALAAFYKIKLKNIWIIYDDKDLPLGTLRIRKKGGSAGHQGLESIIQHLGKKEFIRFRLGTAPTKKFTRATTNFVLGKFNQTEQKIANQIIDQTIEAILVTLEKGIDQAINLCQKKLACADSATCKR